MGFPWFLWGVGNGRRRHAIHSLVTVVLDSVHVFFGAAIVLPLLSTRGAYSWHLLLHLQLLMCTIVACDAVSLAF